VTVSAAQSRKADLHGLKISICSMSFERGTARFTTAFNFDLELRYLEV
jgi:hypothetical protein